MVIMQVKVVQTMKVVEWCGTRKVKIMRIDDADE
jgi:hypothetical protein